MRSHSEPETAQALLRLTEEAAETLSLPDVLGHVCRVTREIVPCDRAAVYLSDDPHEAIALVADHGTPAHLPSRFAPVLYAGTPIVISRDGPRTPEAVEALDDAGLYALAVLPLPGRGSAAGALVVGRETSPGFSETALDVARGVARHAAPLIENARLFTSLEKAAVFRAGVAELAAALNAWNDRPVIARLVCKRGAELFQVTSGVLFRRAGDVLVAMGATGPEAERAARIALSIDDDDTPVVRAFREAGPVFVNAIAPGAAAPAVARELGLCSLLAVPLVGRAGTGGVLVYGDTARPYAFSRAIADEGMLLAAIATGAIERAYCAEVDEARRIAELQAAELTRRAKELTDARNAALAAAQAKAEFLANMSHEIRTPMTAILGYLNLLGSSDTTPAERAAHLGTIRRNGEHLLHILNDILDLSKIEAGKITVDRAPFALVPFVAEIASLMRPRAVEKGLTFAVACTGAIPERIDADATRLRQVLLNLLSNAIKFTETGGVRLGISVAEAPAMLRFDVEDTGIGLSAEAIAKLFAPFTQSDASMTRRFGGTGLGLAISKRLAQTLGGDIEVRSTVGAGSVFSLTIDPGSLDGVPMLEAPDLTPAPEEPVAVVVPETDTSLVARVLLAEDTPDTQRLFAYYLRKAGAEVDIAENGLLARDRALAAAAAGRAYDVILMDMQMPELDGEQATAQLRRAGYRGPIIALTAHAMQSEREKCLRAGCDDFASKPIDPETLVATIRRHLHRSESVASEEQPLVSTLKGDAELMALLDMFIAGLPERVAAMERSLAAADFETLRKQAHQLKGTSAGYGFAPIAEAVARIEASVRSRVDLDTLRPRLEELATLCRRARSGFPSVAAFSGDSPALSAP